MITAGHEHLREYQTFLRSEHGVSGQHVWDSGFLTGQFIDRANDSPSPCRPVSHPSDLPRPADLERYLLPSTRA